MSNKAASAYRSISEASQETGLPAHVLRFWESKFSQIKPMKRAGGRRLYRPQDIQLINGLRQLLYEEGYTIKGAQKYLKEHGVSHVGALGGGELGERADAASLASITAPVTAPADLFDQALVPDPAQAGGVPHAVSRQAGDLRDQLSITKARLDAVIASCRES